MEKLKKIKSTRSRWKESIVYRLYQKNPYVFTIACVFGFCCIVFACQLAAVKLWPGTDDYVFPEMMSPYNNVFEWVSYRFVSWSSRVVPEALMFILLQTDLIIWKIITLVLFVCSSMTAFKIFKLFSKKHEPLKDSVFLGLIMILPICINLDILRSSLFWVTGSINYYWPVAFAIIGAYPVIHILAKNKLPSRLTTVAASIFFVLAVFSQEQVGVAIFVLLAFSLVCLWIKKKKSSVAPTNSAWLYIITACLLSLVALLAMLAAPGNSARSSAELATWLPDMYDVPLLSRLNYSLRWMIDSLVNQLGIIMPMIWALLTVLLVKTRSTGRLKVIKRILEFVLGLAAVIATTRGWAFSAALMDFRVGWGQESMRALLLTIPWIVVLAATVIAPILIYQKKGRAFSIQGGFLSLIVLLSYGLAAVMVFSPTMYASGTRVLFVSSVLVIIAIITLMYKLFTAMRNTSIVRPILMILGSVTLLSAMYSILNIVPMFMRFP